MDPNVPPIDHRLWTYREVVVHILERARNPTELHERFYHLFHGQLVWRVFEIKDWLKEN